MEVTVYLLFIVGLFFIIKGGDFFVESACYIAKITKIPEIIIGATIVSFATALPEVVVSVIAHGRGNTDFAISNAVGSVMANIGLILAISIMIIPKNSDKSGILEKGVIMLLATLLLYGCMYNSRLTIIEAISLLFVLVMFFLLMLPKRGSISKVSRKSINKLVKNEELFKNITGFIIGSIGIFIGAELLVEHGTGIAKIWGVPDAVISITLVAIGTSLPELVTTISALKKGKNELSVGNIFGANIIDICLILPICVIFEKEHLAISSISILQDVGALIILMIIALIPYILRKNFYRTQGFILMTAYFVYLYKILITI